MCRPGVTCDLNTGSVLYLQPGYQFCISAYQNSGAALTINAGSDTAIANSSIQILVNTST